MSACQSTIENIRNLIANYGSVGDEPLELLAESYAAACKEVNARLLRCSQLIRGGNLSEAVRLAEIEPALLETYTLLDFPERLVWAELTRSQQLPVASPLLVEIAKEVHDAFAAVNPLQPLLKKHRLLALSQAPLPQRIAVLREITFMEPDNPGWKADLSAYEKIRFRTLEKEITDAIAAKDVRLMSDLVAELDSQSWTTPPPEKLVTALRKTLKTESHQSALVELRQPLKNSRKRSRKKTPNSESNWPTVGMRKRNNWAEASRWI